MSLRNVLVLGAMIVGTASAPAQTLGPLTTFGTNGWLAPANLGGPLTWLTNDNLTRGLAYNPLTNNVLVASRSSGNLVRVLDGNTGLETGAFNMTGVTGGDFALNMIGVADDGAVYLTNLRTNTSTNTFRVYRWADEATGLTTAPTLAFDGLVTVPSGTPRLGDNFDVTGSGAGTRFVSGFGAGVPGYTLFTTADGTTFTANVIQPVGVGSGEMRLGNTFTTVTGQGTANETGGVWGTQGTTVRRTTYTGDTSGPPSLTGTLDGSNTVQSTERGLDYKVINGIPYLATVTSGSANPNSALVQIFDVTDPANWFLVNSTTTTVGALNANTNGTVAINWGREILDGGGNPTGTYSLYAMATNEGIQAFVFNPVPEPALLGTLGVLAGALAIRRRRAA